MTSCTSCSEPWLVRGNTRSCSVHTLHLELSCTGGNAAGVHLTKEGRGLGGLGGAGGLLARRGAVGRGGGSERITGTCNKLDTLIIFVKLETNCTQYYELNSNSNRRIAWHRDDATVSTNSNFKMKSARIRIYYLIWSLTLLGYSLQTVILASLKYCVWDKERQGRWRCNMSRDRVSAHLISDTCWSQEMRNVSLQPTNTCTPHTQKVIRNMRI